MSARVVRNEPFLVLVCTGEPDQVRALLDTANKDQMDTLSEICSNAVKGRARVTPGQLRVLRENRVLVYKLADPRTTWVQKKQLLRRTRDIEQRGGIIPLLPFLIPILASAGGAAVGALTDKLVRKIIN